MKAVRAYTCDNDLGGRSFVVVTDCGKHISLYGDETPDDLCVGTDMSVYFVTDDERLKKYTNIQPVELPDKEEV